jgi:DnaJ-class molecular chaperone
LDAEDLYAVLGVAPDVDSQDIVAAYNERGAALASAPDFSTNADLKTQLQRLKHAAEVKPPPAHAKPPHYYSYEKT